MINDDHVVSLQTKDEIETEASAWIVQLSGQKPTEEDLSALSDWMNRSTYHKKSLIRLARVWKSADSMPYLIDTIAEQEKIQQANKREGLLPISTVPTISGIVFVVMFGLALLFGYSFFQAPEKASGYYTTEVGVQRTVNLQDGSAIRLNTDSAVEVSYTDDERSVELSRGEAIFDVEKDSSRPFIVTAGDNRIQAVGTAFAVRLKEKEVELTVSEGIVEFSKVDGIQEKPKIRIEASQKASITPTSAQVVLLNEEQLKQTLSWKDGTLIFKGERLDYVIEEITRYTNTDFVFADPSLRSISIGGHFKAGEIEGLIVALKESFGIEVSKKTPNQIILSASAHDKPQVY